MLFQREKKKELWRFASKNCIPTSDGTQDVQIRYASVSDRHLQPSSRIPSNLSNSSFSAKNENLNSTTPPPPYCSLEYGDYAATFYEYQAPSQEFQTNVQQRSTCPSNVCGENAINPNPDPSRVLDSIEKNNHSFKDIKNYQVSEPKVLHIREGKDIFPSSPINSQMFPRSETSTTSSSDTMVSPNFAATAANLLRSCYTCGHLSEKSDLTTPPAKCQTVKKQSHGYGDPSAVDGTPETSKIVQDFKLLMKHIKRCQIPLLLQAVKSRKMTSAQDTISNQPIDCIFVKRSIMIDEEPSLKACRLFFWSELKTISDIKKTPMCQSENDPDYVCCNPLHWYRIIQTDIAPPFYTSEENFLAEEEESLPIKKNYEDTSTNVISQTIDDRDHTSSGNVWCEVAYWELSHRIGPRHLIKSRVFNVCYEGSTNTNGAENICLNKIVNLDTSLRDVKAVRQKIGLGLTISQEDEAIWLFNRSKMPVFIYSPSIYETWVRALKVMPGDCIKVFDYFCIQKYSHYKKSLNFVSGPTDPNSIRLSFGKGWGPNYKRQDLIRCPCWLEIFFKKIN